MKKVVTLCLALILCAVTFAQKKAFRMEVGLNYPLGLEKFGNEENHIGLYINGTYRFADSRLSAKLKVSYESYTALKPITFSDGTGTVTLISNGRSMSVVPSVVYNFPLAKGVSAYTGGGLGLSADNTQGVFNEGCKLHPVVTPQAGIELFKHVNISAQYYITHKDFSRLIFGIGYIF